MEPTSLKNEVLVLVPVVGKANICNTHASCTVCKMVSSKGRVINNGNDIQDGVLNPHGYIVRVGMLDYIIVVMGDKKSWHLYWGALHSEMETALSCILYIDVWVYITDVSFHSVCRKENILWLGHRLAISCICTLARLFRRVFYVIWTVSGCVISLKGVVVCLSGEKLDGCVLCRTDRGSYDQMKKSVCSPCLSQTVVRRPISACTSLA